MDIISLFEQIKFRFFGPKNLEQDLKNRKPEGELLRIDLAQTSIGELEWKKDWVKKFDWNKDPWFRSGLPWYEPDKYNKDFIKRGNHKITLEVPVDSNQEAALFSNFTIKYGTVRALIKLPNTNRAWSAFWLSGTNGLPEHDILEACGGEKDRVHVTHHWGYDYGEKWGKKSTLHNERINKNFKPTEQFYLYEVELSPYKTVYRINGRIVKVMKCHAVSSSDQNIIFSLGPGNFCENDGKPTNKTQRMEIMWLEIYKKIA
jgi:beta-glucanase (GH16 family)